jgi:hypothetical protein
MDLHEECGILVWETFDVNKSYLIIKVQKIGVFSIDEGDFLVRICWLIKILIDLYGYLVCYEMFYSNL